MKTSLKIARREGDLTKKLWLSLVVVSFLGWTICVGTACNFSGFDRGLEVNDGIQEILKSGNFAATGPRIYGYFYQMYLLMAIGFLLNALANLYLGVRNTNIRSALCLHFFALTGIAIVIFFLTDIFREKSLRSQEISWAKPHDLLLKNSMPLDSLVLILAVIAIALQFLLFVQIFRSLMRSSRIADSGISCTII